MRTKLAAIALGLVLPLTDAPAQSLYDESGFRNPAADRRAFRVGDLLTVQVVESSSATSSTDTATKRQNELGVDVTLISPANRVGGAAGVGGSFDGGGRTQRTSRLLATVTVSVQEVLPNGDLRIGGEQSLTVNEEQQVVSVQGRVRPADITGDNVVLSTRIADARILYSGEGDLTGQQRRTWWRRLLDWVGL